MKNKLNKAQNKRFEKWYLEVTDTRKWKDGKPVIDGYLYVTFGNAVKQHLSDECAIAREEGWQAGHKQTREDYQEQLARQKGETIEALESREAYIIQVTEERIKKEIIEKLEKMETISDRYNDGIYDAIKTIKEI